MNSIAASLLSLFTCFCSLAPAARAQEPKKQIVTGTLWIVEGNNKRLPLRGTLLLCYYLETAQGTYPLESQLIVGAFRFEFPAGAEIREPGRVRIEDRDAECQWDGGLADTSKPIELEAHFIPQSRVRVRIRDTGIELDHCKLTYENYVSESRTVALPYSVPDWEEDCPAFGWDQNLRMWANAPVRHGAE